MITPPTEPTPPPMPDLEGALFLRRVRLATYGVVLLVLIIYLLETFRVILQPLFVAMFLGFLMHPIHRWLVRRRIPSMLAYGVILILVALGIFAVSSMMYANVTQLRIKLPEYEERLEGMIRDTVARWPYQKPPLDGHFLRSLFDPAQRDQPPERLITALTTALGRFGDFSSLAALTLVYLLFLIAERVSFPRRVTLAFGDEQGVRVMLVIESINQAIGEYIAVKTFVSALAGIFSYMVLALFGVDFAATWGILIFLLNYIPYLGSLVAVSLPIILSFVQFPEGEMWKGVAITVALIGVQQIIGTVIEPRMAGQRLDVSPLLILLSLAFWGSVWGIVGMILAVPLLVIVRIVLDNIPETKPIATLMSNR